MKKILFVNDRGRFGGVQTVFENIISNIKLDEFNIDILFGSNGIIYDRISKLNYNIKFIRENNEFEEVNIYKNLKLLFIIIKAVNKSLNENKYDIIYANGLLSCIACGILSYKYTKVKFIWHEHNMQSSKLRRKIMKILSRNIKKIIVVSDAIKKNYFIKDEDKVIVIHNGIPCDDKTYLEFKDKEKLNLAIVSRIDIGKGHLEVIDSLKVFNKDYVNLYVIGSATTERGKKIESKIKKNSFKNIHYVGYTKNVSEYYKKVDIVIQASTLWDSLPTVLIEAMNYNCGLIGTEIGGIPEIIEDKVNGYIISNIEMELTQLLSILNNKNILRELQVKSKRVLLNKFSLEKQVNQIENIIKSI